MRRITPDEFNVYTLDELEPDARQRAIETIAEKLGGDWWDQHDIDNVNEAIAYALATALGTPGRENWGEADFPGIDGVKLGGWNLDRGSYLTLRGTLTRENAPALPWADGIIEVNLTNGYGRDETGIDVETDEDDLDPDNELDLTVVREQCRALADAMETAVEDAMHAAMKVGREQMEYISSAEAAVEHIEANEREFYEDGTLYA
jgi:hypothetical protein